jgi:hypothetical protein
MSQRCVLTIAFVLYSATSAFCQQPVTSFEDLVSRLKPSDHVQIIDRGGKKTKGTVVSLTASSMSVAVDSNIRKQTRDFAQNSVMTVWKVEKDSNRNGHLIGGGIGAGLFVLAMFSGGGSDGYNGCMGCFVAVPAALGFGIGALIGGGIDNSNVKMETVFQSGITTTRHFTVAPLVSKEKKGVAAAFRF